MKKKYNSPTIYVVKTAPISMLASTNDKIYNLSLDKIEEDDADEARSKGNSNILWNLDGED